MAGMSNAALGTQAQQKIQAEAEVARQNVQQATGATPAQTAASAPDVTTAQNDAVVNFNQDAFLAALDLTTSEKLALSLPGGKDFQDVLANKTPEQFLNALKAGAGDGGTEELVTLIEQDKELASALHTAAVKDPTVLPGLKEMASNNGTDGLGLDKLKTLLENPVARAKAIEALKQVADTDLTFSHVHTLAEEGNKMASLDMGNFLARAQSDPNGLIQDMLSGSGLEGTQMGGFLANMMQSILPMLGPMMESIMGGMSSMKSSFGAMASKGNDLLADPKTLDDNSTVSYIHKADFTSDMTEAADKIQGDSANDASYDIETLFQANAQIDPKAAAEMKLLKDAVTGKIDTPDALKIRDRFEDVADMTKVEQIAEMQKIQAAMQSGMGASANEAVFPDRAI